MPETTPLPKTETPPNVIARINQLLNSKYDMEGYWINQSYTTGSLSINDLIRIKKEIKVSITIVMKSTENNDVKRILWPKA